MSFGDGFPDQLGNIDDEIRSGLTWIAGGADLAGTDADDVVQPTAGLAVGSVKHRTDDLGASRRGVRHLLLAHERASASEVQLRFALLSDCPVRRVLELTGVHRVLAVYPTLAEAVTGGLPPRSGGPGSQ